MTNSIRLLAIPAVALGLPLGSFLALKMELLPTAWLGLPDAVLSAGALMGLLSSGGALRRIAVGILSSILALLAFRTWPSASAMTYPILFNCFLAYYFYQSLIPGREPVISRVARLERGRLLPADVARYTRNLTWGWCVFFLALAVELSVLAVSTTIETYMLFANTINLLLVAAFFLVEYAYRCNHFPQYPQKSLLHFARKIMDGGWLTDDRAETEDQARLER